MFDVNASQAKRDYSTLSMSKPCFPLANTFMGHSESLSVQREQRLSRISVFFGNELGAPACGTAELRISWRVQHFSFQAFNYIHDILMKFIRMFVVLAVGYMPLDLYDGIHTGQSQQPRALIWYELTEVVAIVIGERMPMLHHRFRHTKTQALTIQ